MNLAQALFRSGRFREALPLFQEVTREFEELGFPRLQLSGLLLQAGTYTSLVPFVPGQGLTEEARTGLSKALPPALEAVELVERMQGTIRSEELLRSWFDREVLSAYEIAISLLAVLEKPADAFHLSERARSRSLLRLLGPGRLQRAQGSPQTLRLLGSEPVKNGMISFQT